MAVALAIVGLRALQLALTAPAEAPRSVIAAAPGVSRGDIVDRNGVLLATNVPAFVLTATPRNVVDPEATAAKLVSVLPDLDQAVTARRLAQKNRGLVQLRRGLTPRQRQAVFDLALPGIGFGPDQRRFYPQGALARHAIGQVDGDLTGIAGVEHALDANIRRAGAADKAVRLTVDVRVQYALEQELAAAAISVRARGGAGLVVDGKTGEVLALASYPTRDANAPWRADDPATFNRAAAAVFEMGSTIKPFTYAQALDLGIVGPAATIDVTPLAIGDVQRVDPHPLASPAPLTLALAKSSNVAAARLALRVGAVRQRAMFEKLGLSRKSDVELSESARPIAPSGSDDVTVAVLGYGHGFAMSLAALAGAYTVFANGGALAPLTLLAGADRAPLQRVFSPEATAAVIAMMRAVVEEGTGARAAEGGVDLIGKTGTAEKPGGAAGYDATRMLSSFVGMFPAREPRYVVVLALDEPERAQESGGQATGGAVAAPAVGLVAARIAPMLDLDRAPAGGGGRVEAARPTKAVGETEP
jgi:cell division protein FtsI (penicillin-binding protein 3)